MYRSNSLIIAVIGGMLIGGCIAISLLYLVSTHPLTIQFDSLFKISEWSPAWFYSVMGLSLMLVLLMVMTPLRYSATSIGSTALLFAGVLVNIWSFRDIDQGDFYQLDFYDHKDSLVELIERSPDQYSGLESIAWLSHVVPGSVMHIRRSAVTAVGFSPHRLAGVAKVKIAYLDDRNSATQSLLEHLDRKAPLWGSGFETREGIESPLGTELRIATDARIPNTLLCAWLVNDDILLIGRLPGSPCEELM